MRFGVEIKNVCNGVSSYICDVERYYTQAMNDFRRDPIGYIKSSIADFVDDEWDAGIVFGLGCFCGRNPNYRLGAEYIILLGSMAASMSAGIFDKNTDIVRRFFRNMFIGLGALCCGTGNVPLNIAGVTSRFLLAGLIDLDMRVHPGNILFYSPKQQQEGDGA